MASRVFLVWEHPLLRKTLQALLDHTQIEWVGDCSNLDELPLLLEIHQPDVVLVEEYKDHTNHRAAQVLSICKQSRLRVIGINLSGNDVQHYEFDKEILSERDDLLKLILKE